MDWKRELRGRLDEVHGRHRRRPDLPRRELLIIIEELIEILVWVLEHAHIPQPQRSVTVQVVVNDAQQVKLHAVEENAEGEPIDKDSATAVWSADRTDIGTITPDGFDCEFVAVGGGATGDTTVTVTVTEPDTTNDDGTTTPGAVYVGTQVVTVNVDETISQVEISADTPEAKPTV